MGVALLLGVMWLATLSLLWVPGLASSFSMIFSGVAEVTTAAGTIASASANVTQAVAVVLVTTSHEGIDLVHEAWHGVDLHELKLEVEAGKVMVDDVSLFIRHANAMGTDQGAVMMIRSRQYLFIIARSAC